MASLDTCAATPAPYGADRAIHGGFDCAIAGAIWWDGQRGGKHRLCRCILGPRARSFAHFGLRKLTSAAISSGGDRQLHRAYVARDAAICAHLLLLRILDYRATRTVERPHCINRTDRFRCPPSRRAPWGRRLAPKNDDVLELYRAGFPGGAQSSPPTAINYIEDNSVVCLPKALLI